MKIVITGSAGFVGRYLAKRLIKLGHEVIPLDISNAFDITHWDEVKKLPKFDICVHLAAKTFVPDSYTDTRVFYHVNMIGTLNMLELCKIHNAKVIFASSYVYGKPNYLPIDENHQVIAFNPYAHSKIIGEQLCENYNKFFNMPVIILRPFNIYGFGQSSNFLIPEILNKSLRGKMVELLDAAPKRDMIYIDDVVDAYVAAINANVNFGIFNIGSGQSYSVEQIAQLVMKNIGESNYVVFKNEKRINEVDNVIADISKIKKMLNWQPKTAIDEGIYKTVQHFKGK